MFRFCTLAAVVLSYCLGTARGADDAADPKTLMTVRGKLLASEDLSKPVEVSNVGSLSKLAAGWRLRPGKWEFVDGVLKGTQLKADNHGAVASYALPLKDAIIQVDCRFDDARRITLRVNDANEHVCRVVLTKDGFSAQKDDHDHTGPDRAVPFGEIALPIAPGEWKTVLLEIKGDELVAMIDGRSITGSHPLIGSEKANIGFVVGGNSASFRNLRIWEALPNPAWPENKSRITSADHK